MKNNILCIFTILTCLLGCDKYDDSEVKSDIKDLKSRVEALEQQCKNMNANLTSLQAIVEAIQKQDGIVSVDDLPGGQGYSVKFVSGKVIFLYNGKNGEDGVTPMISVKKDSDGKYYWTVDGEWLLVDGEKVRADGDDGADGKEGVTPQFKIEGDFWYVSYDNGKSWKKLGKASGNDGNDAITPQFKIEDGYWYVSYDNGKSWTKLGKASGDNGRDGVDGKNGDAFFKSVTINDGYVVFVMNDADQTTLRIPLARTAAVSSIKYVPENLDGVVKVKYYMDGGKIVPEDVMIKFEVLPQGAADYVVENWEDVLVAKAIYVSSTKAGIGDFVALNVKGAVKDVDNIIIVSIDAGSFDDVFFSTSTPAGANLRLSVKLDGNEEVSSDYLPMVPCLSTDKVIEYTSVSGKVMSSECFDIRTVHGIITCTNSYNGDYGRITFESPTYYSQPEIECDFSYWKNPITILENKELKSLRFATPIDLYGLRFERCVALEKVDLANVNTYNCNDMSFMFDGCSKITSLDLSAFNTTNVEGMLNMFKNCNRLTGLDLSGFKTENVKSMGGMFEGCINLTGLDLSGFKTENVEDMSGMFKNCNRLTGLDLSGFKTENVKDMRGMFEGCINLTSLDLPNFNTENVNNMCQMFQNCSSLANLDLSSFNTKNVEDMTCMFQNCERLTYLDMSGFHTGAVKGMHSMFWGCGSLKSLDLSSFDTRNVNSMGCMFIYCSSLANLNLSSFRTDNVTNMVDMFDGCSSLVSLDLSGFNTGRAIHMAFMFHDCGSLTSLDLSSFNTRSCTSLAGMFWGCGSLKSLDLSNFNTNKVTYMNRMFQDCGSLVTLDLSGFNMENVVDTSYMFDGCDNLKKILMRGCNKKTIEMINAVKPEEAVIVTG